VTSYSSSSQQTSSDVDTDAELKVQAADAPVPTIGRWLGDLEILGMVCYDRWELLHRGFASEGCLDVLITSIAMLPMKMLREEYKLLMVDIFFLVEELEVAGKNMVSKYSKEGV
jgi:hypothetical protein